ncbi:MAG: dihydroorotase [Candidatus Micrarchaeia archaeon]|jgi:dihydroorotase
MILGNINVYLNGSVSKRYIEIDVGKIKRISNSVSKKEKIINGKGLLVLPGLIDPHVHLREPGLEQKEDFYTGSLAAIAGGFTTVIDMPNNPKPTIDLKRLKEKIKLSRKAECDVFFHFGAAQDNFKEIRQINPNSLKIILGQTTGNLLIKDYGIVEKHFRNFDRKKPIVIHAEDQEYINKTGDDGPNASWIAVEKVCNLAKKTNRLIYIAHTSTKKEIEIAKRHKQVLVEVAPHYLFLSKKNYSELGFRKEVKPSLRDENYRKELWENLDKIDCIGSDHAPHLLKEKENGAYGFPGLETSFHLFLNAYYKKLVGIDWIVEKMCKNPAKIFNIKNKGETRPGNDADFIFVDMKKEWVLKEEDLYTKCRWSPYNRWKFKGKVSGVMHKGKMKYQDFEFQL